MLSERKLPTPTSKQAMSVAAYGDTRVSEIASQAPASCKNFSSDAAKKTPTRAPNGIPYCG